MKKMLFIILLLAFSLQLHAAHDVTITAKGYESYLPPEVMRLINKVFFEHCAGALMEAKKSPRRPYVSYVDSYNSYDIEVVYNSRFPDDMVAQFVFDYTLGGKLPTEILIRNAYSDDCDTGTYKVK